jgi:uncharacterized protein (DUF952 family)
MKKSLFSKTNSKKEDNLVNYIAENAIRDTLRHKGYSPAELFLHMYQGDIDSAGERVSGKERVREKVR